MGVLQGGAFLPGGLGAGLQLRLPPTLPTPRCAGTPPPPSGSSAGGPRSGLSQATGGESSLRASSFLLLPEACRAPPPGSCAPSLSFPPSLGRLLLLRLLPFSPALSLPARNPFRPGSRSGLAAVCPTPRPSGGPPSRASACWCARLSAAQVSTPPPLRGPPSQPVLGSPRPGPPWRRVAGPRGLLSPLPPLPRQSRGLGGWAGRTGFCPGRPFVVMPRREGAGRGAPGCWPCRDLLRLTLPLRAP